MAIKSFLSLPVKAERASLALATAFCVFALAGCQGLKTREDIDKEKAPAPATGRQETPAPGPQEPPPVHGQAPTVATPPPAPTPLPAPAPDSFLTKEPLKVGLILGPGGMRTYAHIGALKEMSRARLPIKGVVGLEWGAVMAGLYAMQGQANEVEWKAFKLRADDVPENGGILSRGLQPERIAELGNFLSTIYAGQTIDRAKVDFACPSYNIRTEKFVMQTRGAFKDIVSRCTAYPPYYTDTDGWLAEPFAIEEAAQHLRARGANLIIYVNALGGGELVDPKIAGEQYASSVLWSELRRQAARGRLPGVNIVINVNTGTNGITDYENRRQIMEAGARAAQEVVNKLVTQYGF